jgi:ribose transport system substrate-binding protein
MTKLAFRLAAIGQLFSSILVFVAATIILSACGQSGPAATEDNSADKKPVVALIMKSLANEFFVAMADGAKAHQQANPEQYELLVNGIKDESDLTQQVALVEQMMAKGVDAIVIAPADSKALVPVLKRAAKNGITVVNIDNKLDAEVLAQAGFTAPFVGPDNRDGAKTVGDYLATQLPAEAEVAIIGGIATAFNSQQRQQGFVDAMSNANMTIVSQQNGDWMQAKASTITAALVAEYPNLAAILCANDSMAIGAAAALKQAGKAEQIKVVGFDNIQAAQALISEGRMVATADQYGGELAVFGIEFALDILAGSTPADKKTPVDLVTADSLNQ